MISAFLPSVQDWLVLSLVIGAAKRECVLGPDDECGPMATRIRKAFWSVSSSECVRELRAMRDQAVKWPTLDLVVPTAMSLMCENSA